MDVITCLCWGQSQTMFAKVAPDEKSFMMVFIVNRLVSEEMRPWMHLSKICIIGRYIKILLFYTDDLVSHTYDIETGFMPYGWVSNNSTLVIWMSLYAIHGR